jgi:hypothetical protein
MKNYFNKMLTILFSLTLALSVSTKSFAYADYILKTNEKIKITVEQEKRLLEYLKGEYYSNSMQTSVRFKAPMFFLLSSEGNSSSLISCNDYRAELCPIGVEVAQMKMKAEKNTDQKVSILFIKDEFVVNHKKIHIHNYKEWNDLKKQYFENVSQPKNYFYDIIISDYNMRSGGAVPD